MTFEDVFIYIVLMFTSICFAITDDKVIRVLQVVNIILCMILLRY